MRKVYRRWKVISEHMGRKNINAYAASIAFFLFLSVVPMLIVLCAVLPYTPLTEENLLEAVAEVVPDMVEPLAASLISDVYDKSAGIMSVAIIATIWSAGKGIMALMQGLNVINGVEEKRRYFTIRAIASLYTLAMLVIVMLSLFLNVFGNQLLSLALYRLPGLQKPAAFLMNFRFLVVWVVMTILFAAIYAYVPDVKLRFRDQIPGAAFAAVMWSVFSWGFSLYVTYSNSYSVYGSLSLVIIALLWLYFSMYLFLIGAYLNQTEKQTET